MSDFTSEFWSLFVAVGTIVSVVACLWLLIQVGFKRVNVRDDNTTGHVWDGDLVELNNPMPKWWMGLFVITIVFAGVYLLLYPGLGNFAGRLGWSSDGAHQAEADKLNKSAALVTAKFAGLAPEQLAKTPAAMEIAQRLFLNNCAQCHGSDGGGFKGFPNLTDTDWLWGGDPKSIAETIRNGRTGVMPPMASALPEARDVEDVSHYVMSLSNSAHDSVKAQLGKAKFSACVACHGVGGKGNPALGAPNLTDDVWLHGWGTELVAKMIREGKTNVMPKQEGRLDEQQIQLLTAYVWGLSNKTATK
jgi:cytochrome c oxidase cbb3-type subunit III